MERSKSPNISDNGTITPKFKCGETAFVIRSNGKIAQKNISIICCDGFDIWYIFTDSSKAGEDCCYKSEAYAKYMLEKLKKELNN